MLVASIPFLLLFFITTSSLHKLAGSKLKEETRSCVQLFGATFCITEVDHGE
jgi:hypothetical protein